MKTCSSLLKDFFSKNEGKSSLLEHEAKGLLKRMGFSVPRGIFISKGSMFRESDFELSYPLAVKVSSSKIVSKSDIDGIRLGIKNEGELKTAISGLMNIEHAEGVLVEEMVDSGLEVIVGGIIDGQFGSIVMFGLGGIFVELFRDVSFGLAPLKDDEAMRLVKQVKGYRLLEGYRGRPPVDMDALTGIIVGVSDIMAAGVVREIDLNPVVLYAKGAMIVDAKMQMV